MKPKVWKLISIISILSLLTVGVILLRERSVTPTQPSKVSKLVYKNSQELFDRFLLTGVRWVHHEGSDKLFSLRADKMVHQPYSSRFFAFYNLKEIYISDLTVEFYPKSWLSPPDASTALEEFQEIVLEDLTSLTNRSPNMDGGSDINSEQLGRIKIGRLTVVTEVPLGSKVILSADRAITSWGFHNIALQGHFSLTSADGKHLIAPEAVWLGDWNILYFPRGYQITGKKGDLEKNQDFLAIDARGRLIAPSRFPPVKPKLKEFEDIDVLLCKALSQLFPWLAKMGSNLSY